MQIDKLAAYHRIPETLAREAHRRGTRPLFSNIRLEYVDPYRPVQSSISLSGKKVHCHVHAEVQMVIHYIVQPALTTPRIIGTSKAACFLCHLFITEHKIFSVSAWHGRLYDQWTIPDLKEYSSSDITALRATVQGMHHKFAQLRAKRHPWRPFPLTSRHNLQHLPIFSPTPTVPSVSRPASTVAEADEPRDISIPCLHASGTPASPGVHEPDVSEGPSVADGPPTLNQSNRTLDSEVVVESNKVRTPVLENHGLDDGHQMSGSSASISSGRILHLRPGKPRVVQFPHVNIHAEIEPPSMGMLTLREGSEGDISSAGRVVNLEDLTEGYEPSFERRDSESSIVVQFQKGGIGICYVVLEWT
ncbi:hypothetical protein AYL99_09960 [Fonsecaea erecta]|uniref:Uncharacterized protein n=1 Tax=Fonsecaea erecta TaxID=1367422 RepID=A0A178Z7N8_9EURO|nr:hypothetical protein AYL99_09960 [Fonsecaea erecta]OAP55808.1 hypothetical protein AYL99_09960 [Fonsecaea erecta]